MTYSSNAQASSHHFNSFEQPVQWRIVNFISRMPKFHLTMIRTMLMSALILPERLDKHIDLAIGHHGNTTLSYKQHQAQPKLGKLSHSPYLISTILSHRYTD